LAGSINTIRQLGDAGDDPTAGGAEAEAGNNAPVENTDNDAVNKQLAHQHDRSAYMGTFYNGNLPANW